MHQAKEATFDNYVCSISVMNKGHRECFIEEGMLLVSIVITWALTVSRLTHRLSERFYTGQLITFGGREEHTEDHNHFRHHFHMMLVFHHQIIVHDR